MAINRMNVVKTALDKMKDKDKSHYLRYRVFYSELLLTNTAVRIKCRHNDTDVVRRMIF